MATTVAPGLTSKHAFSFVKALMWTAFCLYFHTLNKDFTSLKSVLDHILRPHLSRLTRQMENLTKVLVKLLAKLFFPWLQNLKLSTAL